MVLRSAQITDAYGIFIPSSVHLLEADKHEDLDLYKVAVRLLTKIVDTLVSYLSYSHGYTYRSSFSVSITLIIAKLLINDNFFSVK